MRLASMADMMLASVVVGDSDEDIHLLDVLFRPAAPVGGIAVEHDGIVQLLGQFGGALLVSLDKFDVVVFFQLGGRAGADVAATDDRDALIRFSSRCSSLITARMCCDAATKNTSSPASIMVEPCGRIGLSRRKIAATRVSICGMCSRIEESALPTSGPP